MPELPEVETVVHGLRPLLVGRVIAAVTHRAPKPSIVVGPSLKGESFERILIGRQVLAITRRGKNILIALSGELTLWVHLKMTGHFEWCLNSVPLDKHDLVVIDFESDSNVTSKGTYHLRFNDYRRFGRLRLYRDDELWAQKGLKELGPEPLEIPATNFAKLCRRRPRMIKAALLDQSFMAGVGNIYADESLYSARIHPRRLTTSLSPTKLAELHGHLLRLLKRAIKLHGTSVDSYSGVNGRAGGFQTYLAVYGREGEPCSRCGTAIVRRKIGARSAHFCPKCQRVR